MNRLGASVGSFLFFLVAPGVVAGLVPWWISGWHMRPPFLGWRSLQMAGIALIALGVPVLLDSFVRFALEGRGTPAPILPTEHLVVTGLYRFVRNPMYVGVLSVILGQGLLLGDARLLRYGAVVWLAFALFVIGYEEPTLRRTFGEEYERFCANVPRWIPRLRPWRGE
ncbi:MAG: isoprenylcysteine carboxylmethyltransferase family protein [Terriglobales bacterium]